MDCEGNFSLGLAKSIVIDSVSNDVEVGQKFRIEPGPSAHSHKKPPPFARGKKILIRSICPKSDLNIAATPLWKFSSANLTTLSSIHIVLPISKLNHYSAPTFEFMALAKSGLDHQHGRNVDQLPVDRRVDPSTSDGQQQLNCVRNDEEVAGFQSDPGSREGAVHEDVGDERMVSVEGDGSTPSV